MVDRRGDAMRMEVLGPLRVRGRKDVEITRPSHRRVLSILALDANRQVPTETLIDRLWAGAPPPSARATLQMHVAALRRILPADALVTENGGYRLDLERHGFDVDDLHASVSAARRAAGERDWEFVLGATNDGVRLWRGDPYPDLAHDDFARLEVRRLEELAMALVQLKVDALLELDRTSEALPELELLVAAHPLREGLWEQLMRARYRLGRHAEALDAYRQAWDVFSEIGLEPSASLRRLEREILRHDESLLGRGPNNLPLELTAFVGREREVEAVLDLLAEQRHVTLTGVGGGGKTRLALRAAALGMAEFPDGRWLAELVHVSDPDLVALELADAIGIRTRGDRILPALTAALSHHAVLVVLDNCEHVLDGAAALARALLESGPGVRVLATSREPLRVPGEVLYEVPPMPFPTLETDESLAFDAVRLFEARASLVRPSLAFDAGASRAAAEICRRVDGIPLAIELAAARVATMRPEEIARQLDDSFRLLATGTSNGPERHRTLDAAFEWSYELLTEPERRLVARLSVFRGSFGLDAVVAVCAGGAVERDDVVSLVAALVDKSLVTRVDTPASTRYRLLETVREYADARLEALGEVRAVRGRLAAWCVDFAADVAAAAHASGRWEVFERLDAESANVEAAFDDAREGRVDADSAALAHALAWNALDLGRLDRCISYLRSSLESTADLDSELARRSLLGTALFLSGEGDAGFEEAERAALLVVDAVPSRHSVPALTTYARLHLLLLDQDPAAAIPLSRRALEIAEAWDDPFAKIYALRSLGRSLVWNGAADEGLAHYQAGLELALSTGDRAMLLETYESLFVLLYLNPTARRHEPRRIADQMLERFSPGEQRWGRYTPADWLPRVFLGSGEWDRAEEAIERMRDRHLEGWDHIRYLLYRASLERMRGELGLAQRRLADLEELGVEPSWYYEYFPLLADVAADQRRLADVRAAAEEYLAHRAHPSEEASKLAVLASAARAEADAALVARRSDRSQHVRRARAAVERGRHILATYPPLVAGSLQAEVPLTSLILAEAELSRATSPDPALWRALLEAADTAYLRVYAQARLAEALLHCDRREEGGRELRVAHEEASRLGAGHVTEVIAAIARSSASSPRVERVE